VVPPVTLSVEASVAAPPSASVESMETASAAIERVLLAAVHASCLPTVEP
jgi:hypothetical protein